MTAPLSLGAQLAMTLASICECRHLATAHNAQGCTACACGEFTRRTENDRLALDTLGPEHARRLVQDGER